MSEAVKNIRIATPADIDGILELLKLMYAEMPVGTLSEARLRLAIEACLQNGGVLVAEENGEIVATQGFIPAQWRWSEDWYIEDQWCFTKRGFRDRDYARRMQEEAVKTAKSIGMDYFTGVFSGERTRAKVELWKRMFGEPIGAIFLVRH